MTTQIFDPNRKTVQRFDETYVNEQIEMFGEVEECASEVVCPYCGWLEEDIIETDENDYNYKNHKLQCGNCEKWFYLSCKSERKFYYRTSRQEL